MSKSKRAAPLKLNFVVVGGSLGGLAVAYELATSGHYVHVIEKKEGLIKVRKVSVVVCHFAGNAVSARMFGNDGDRQRWQNSLHISIVLTVAFMCLLNALFDFVIAVWRIRPVDRAPYTAASRESYYRRSWSSHPCKSLSIIDLPFVDYGLFGIGRMCWDGVLLNSNAILPSTDGELPLQDACGIRIPPNLTRILERWMKWPHEDAIKCWRLAFRKREYFLPSLKQQCLRRSNF